MVQLGIGISRRRRLTVCAAAAVAALMVFEGPASAQVRTAADIRPTDHPRVALYVGTPQGDAPRTPQLIRDSLSSLDYRRLADDAGKGAAQASTSSRKRSVGRKILGGAIGATAGLFAGGYLGAKIEGDRCNCDDPGLVGALIGAPVGAVAGGILGALVF